MDQHHQQELRRAAARAFIESLDQLEETLQTDGKPAKFQHVKRPEPEISVPGDFDLGSFEQAVEDIEEFIQAKNQDQA